MQIMNILWDKGCGMTTHEIIDVYPEPRPAYSTIATFMKILTHKKYVISYKRDGGGKTYVDEELEEILNLIDKGTEKRDNSKQ